MQLSLPPPVWPLSGSRVGAETALRRCSTSRVKVPQERWHGAQLRWCWMSWRKPQDKLTVLKSHTGAEGAQRTCPMK